ncbi:hypothetical protein KIPB_014589, partial [Kipferlia bialata]|eukprot:g14589.t1
MAQYHMYILVLCVLCICASVAAAPTGATLSPLSIPTSISTPVSVCLLDADGDIDGAGTHTVELSVPSVDTPLECVWSVDTGCYQTDVTLCESGTVSVSVDGETVQE